VKANVTGVASEDGQVCARPICNRVDETLMRTGAHQCFIDAVPEAGYREMAAFVSEANSDDG
jgi:hypothetical protein